MIVLIDNGSIGKVVCAPTTYEIGSIVKIELQDENGNKITQLGTIQEIVKRECIHCDCDLLAKTTAKNVCDTCYFGE